MARYPTLELKAVCDACGKSMSRQEVLRGHVDVPIERSVKTLFVEVGIRSGSQYRLNHDICDACRLRAIEETLAAIRSKNGTDEKR